LVTDRLVSVAVPVPALGLLTYRVPDAWPVPPAGARVVVPLGKRTLVGVCVGDAAAPGDNVVLKDLREVMDAEAFVPADVLALTAWVSDYYLAGPGAALAAALPPRGLTPPRGGRPHAFKTVRVIALTAEGIDVAQRLRAAADGAPG
jgi:primosomal protein N' (replication factor Y)